MPSVQRLALLAVLLQWYVCALTSNQGQGPGDFAPTAARYAARDVDVRRPPALQATRREGRELNQREARKPRALFECHRLRCTIEVDCQDLRERLYDEGVAVWNLTDGDVALPVMMACVDDGDTILLSASVPYPISEALRIDKNLTISTGPEFRTDDAGLPLRARPRARLTHSNKKAGLLNISAGRVVLANVVVENCSFDVRHSPIAFGQSVHTASLLYVAFRDVQSAAAPVTFRNAASVVSLSRVSFIRLRMRAPVLLPKKVSMQRVTVANCSGNSGVFFEAEEDANIRVHRSAARYNTMAVMRLSSGRLNISMSRFLRNGRNTQERGAIQLTGQVSLGITDSKFEKNRARKGAAIYASEATVRAEGCEFTRQRARNEGGGAYFLDTDAEFINCQFDSNEAVNDAGAVRSEDGELSFKDCRFEGNKAKNSAASVLVHDQKVAFENCSFVDNHAEFACVLRAERAKLDFRGCTVKNGSGSNSGGVFHLDASPFNIANSIFVNNSAAYGGVMYVHNAQKNSVIRNSVFRKNEGFQMGGAIAFDLGKAIRMENVTFEENTAAFGGGMHFYRVEKVEASELSLLKNVAADGGAFAARFSNINIFPSPENATSFGIWTKANVATGTGGALNLDNSTVAIERSRFSHDRAVEGGAIQIQGADSNVTVLDTVFEHSHAEESGGAVHARCDGDKARVEFALTIFSDCKAQHTGGAVYLASLDAILTDCKAHKNEAGDDGGAFFFTHDSKARNVSVDITRLEATSNRALGSGGAIEASSSAVNLTIQSSRIANNFAGNDRSGGGVHVVESHLRLDDATVSKNRAGEGAGVHVQKTASIAIRGSTFASNEARTRGGGLLLAKVAPGGRFERTKFWKNEADKGGAIVISGSEFRGVAVELSHNVARKKGGAIDVDRESRLLCRSCRFAKNSAEIRGGAAAIDARDGGTSAEFIDCLFEGNTANFGGGIHYEKDYASQRSCRRNRSLQCGGLVVLWPRFVRNDALNGSAIHSNAKEFILLTRPPPSAALASMSEFPTREELSELQNAHELDPCDLDVLEGSLPGQSFTTYATNVRVEAEGLGVADSNPRYFFENVISGTAIPTVRLLPSDACEQFPVPSIAGALEPQLNGTLLTSSLRAAGQDDGTYIFPVFATKHTAPSQCEGTFCDLMISFAEADNLKPINVSVQLRSCQMGETQQEEGAYCRECGVNSFTVRPEDGECRPCPEHADCGGSYVLPDSGYWSRSPCHNTTLRCLNSAACSGVKRRYQTADGLTRAEFLLNFTEQFVAETCPLNASLQEEFRAKQCSEGYEGILCGVCSDGLVHTPVYTCLRCPHWAATSSVLVVATAFVVVLVVITIRGNKVSPPTLLRELVDVLRDRDDLPSTVKELSVPETPSRFSDSAHERDDPGPTSSVVGSVWRSRSIDVELKNLGERNGDPATCLDGDRHKHKEAVLAKWRVCEVMKISVNFLQAISIATAINVEWRDSVLGLLWASDLVSGAPVEAVSGSIYCLTRFFAAHPSVATTIAVLFGPQLIALGFLLVCFVHSTTTKRSPAEFLKRFLLSFIAIQYFTYLTTTRQSAFVFLCLDVPSGPYDVPGDTSSYWVRDTSLLCGSEEHRVLQLLAALFIGLVSIGFPFMSAATYFCFRSLSQRQSSGVVYDIMGFMFRGYAAEYGYWEGTVLLRKACLSLIAVFSYDMGGSTQGLLASFVLIVSLVIHTQCRPYREEFKDLNNLEACSLLFSCTTYLASGFFVEGGGDPEWIKVLMSTYLLMTILGFVLLMAGKFVHAGFKFFKADLEAADVSVKGASFIMILYAWVEYRCYLAIMQKE